jgi:hypothetical protein
MGIGCNLCAKSWFTQQLRQRAGFGSIFNFSSPFIFQSDSPQGGGAARWKNSTQLEAVVEFYVNLYKQATNAP